MFRIASALIVSIVALTACNGGLTDELRRQHAEDQAKLQQQEKANKKKDAIITAYQKDRESTRRIMQETIGEQEANAPANATSNQAPSANAQASNGSLTPFIAAVIPPAVRPDYCANGVTGPWVGYAGMSFFGNIDRMAIGDRSVANGCEGACLIVTNRLSQYVEIRITAADPARPGLIGNNAAVMLCNGAAPLSVAPVRRTNNITEQVSLLPPGSRVIIGKIFGSATVTYTPVTSMPLGTPWIQGHKSRTETYTFPKQTPTGMHQELQFI